MLLQDLKDPAHQPQLRAEARLSQALREADAVVIGAGGSVRLCRIHLCGGPLFPIFRGL